MNLYCKFCESKLIKSYEHTYAIIQCLNPFCMTTFCIRRNKILNIDKDLVQYQLLTYFNDFYSLTINFSIERCYLSRNKICHFKELNCKNSQLEKTNVFLNRNYFYIKEIPFQYGQTLNPISFNKKIKTFLLLS